jgi:hypothetical protein
MPLSPKQLLPAALAAAALAGAVAGPAQADSFAYLNGGDVWLTTTDGARQFQVTGTGEYAYVSQADDGTIVATTQSGDLQRLDRLGRVLSTITTPVSQATNGGSTVFYGPLDADVSPDGRSVAYGFIKMGTYKYPDGTVDADLYDGHGFTRSDALTGFLDSGFKYATDWSGPEWIDDQTVLVSNGPGWPSDPIAIEKVGSGDPRSWFTDPDNTHPMEATISRDRRWVAAVKGPDRLALSVYRIGDGALETATINPCFTYSDPAGFRYDSPTISGDGRTIAWGSGKSLYIAPLGDASAKCPDGQQAREVIPGADNPDWGPADVPTARPADVPLRTPNGGGGSVDHGGGTTPAPAPNVKGGPGPAPAPAPGPRAAAAKLTVRVGATRLAKALRSGLTVTVTAPKAGKLSAVARDAKGKVASGAAAAKADKSVKVKLSFAKAAKARLKRAKKVALTLTVTGGGLSKATKITIKR